jgi:hypothetical protein
MPDSGHETGFAYDVASGVIGGGIEGGVFFAFRPSTRSWTAESMQAVSGAPARPGRIAFHAIDYDPIGNVFVFVTDQASGRRTWAYRYRRADPGTARPAAPAPGTASGATPASPALDARDAR